MFAMSSLSQIMYLLPFPILNHDWVFFSLRVFEKWILTATITFSYGINWLIAYMHFWFPCESTLGFLNVNLANTEVFCHYGFSWLRSFCRLGFHNLNSLWVSWVWICHNWGVISLWVFLTEVLLYVGLPNLIHFGFPKCEYGFSWLRSFCTLGFHNLNPLWVSWMWILLILRYFSTMGFPDWGPVALHVS